MTEQPVVPEAEAAVEEADESPETLPTEGLVPLIDEDAADVSDDVEDEAEDEEVADIADLPDDVRDGDVGVSEPEET